MREMRGLTTCKDGVDGGQKNCRKGIRNGEDGKQQPDPGKERAGITMAETVRRGFGVKESALIRVLAWRFVL